MSECKLDHSHDDVRQKYEQQEDYLPKDMVPLFESFFGKEHTQELLNDVFHLLKKYDLSTEDEKEKRNNRLYLVLKNV
ncbi:group-specific protein [Bacillus sp. S/N-304-OC-R1]|uniref:group-specific protein n=1 Tax=Bacillus sp. S/N-304-OC-R1 TaxID=2758034 RepID=UPI001C8EADEE|nr:group-specific protein [Bacillus sp. S/N-304-OC-R1]MBY0120564.1 group-specific protein [Bacillus sp. S/N-304-OC-R1]